MLLHCVDFYLDAVPLSMLTAESPDFVPPELRSTGPHRALTLAGSLAILASFHTIARLVVASGSPTADLLAVAMAVFVGYSLTDLATGVYHWLIDNYGNADTLVLGPQIAAFQDHHLCPSAVMRLETCDNLHVAAGIVAIALPVAGTALSTAAAHAFAGTFAACAMLSVQFHAWAQKLPARLPPGVAALQDAGVLLSRSQHAWHHRPPHNSTYCTVSGTWNGVLDRYKVFEAVEKVIYYATGVQPRSWGMKM
ncbi:unnamed protein product [Urochloa humidicola]